MYNAQYIIHMYACIRTSSIALLCTKDTEDDDDDDEDDDNIDNDNKYITRDAEVDLSDGMHASPVAFVLV